MKYPLQGLSPLKNKVFDHVFILIDSFSLAKEDGNLI